MFVVKLTDIQLSLPTNIFVLNLRKYIIKSLKLINIQNILTMTTQEIANRLVELCRIGKFDQVVKELYSSSIVSVEPEGVPNRVVSGLDGIAEKSKNFEAMIESYNSSIISDPLVADNIFSCAMLMNVNMKGVPVPVDMNEICVYTVADGKIVKEEFFYTPQPNKG